MTFQAGVTSTNDEDIDVLMGTKTPGADNLIGAKEEESTNSEDKGPKKTEPKKSEAKDTIANTTSQEEDADFLLGGDEEEEKTDEPKKVEEKKLPKQESKKQEPTKKTSLPQDMDVDYQAIYQKMVDDGIWEEVEIPEGQKDYAKFDRYNPRSTSSQDEIAAIKTLALANKYHEAKGKASGLKLWELYNGEGPKARQYVKDLQHIDEMMLHPANKDMYAAYNKLVQHYRDSKE